MFLCNQCSSFKSHKIFLLYTFLFYFMLFRGGRIGENVNGNKRSTVLFSCRFSRFTFLIIFLIYLFLMAIFAIISSFLNCRLPSIYEKNFSWKDAYQQRKAVYKKETHFSSLFQSFCTCALASQIEISSFHYFRLS